MSEKLSVGNNPTLYTNVIAYDKSFSAGVAYFSAFGYASHMQQIEKDLNMRNRNIYCCGYYFSSNPGDQYDTIVSKVSGSDYSHLIAYKKDRVTKNERSGEETLTGYFFWENEHDKELFQYCDSQDVLSRYIEENKVPVTFYDKFFDKLYKLSPLPVIREWAPYLAEQLVRRNCLRHLRTIVSSNVPIHLNAFMFSVDVSTLKNIISAGLKTKKIVISSTNNGVSQTMRDVSGLDSYLNSFRDVLARRIQNSFVPRFIPGEDHYSQELNDIADYDSYMGRLDLFDAQKGVIQAASNALNHGKTVFVIGEPGVGKTAMATVTTLVNNRGKKGMTNIVMCPGHLVEKWKKEIERLAPHSEAVIVSDFDELTALVPKIKDRNRFEHLWLIISKETAKFGYQERPAAVWSRSAGAKVGHPEGVYVCPECGKPLYTVTYEGRGHLRREVRHYMGANAFEKKTAYNVRCMNKVKKFNTQTKEYEEVPCNAKLWEALGKADKNTDGKLADSVSWVNLGARCGWIERDKIQYELDRITSIQHPKREDSAKILPLSEALDGEIPPQKAPIKYPLSRYVRKYLKGYIDYAMIDEVNMWASLHSDV